MYTKEHLGSLLLKAGEISAEQLEEALNYADANNMRVGEVLVKKGFTTEDKIQQFLGIQLGYPTIKLDHTYIDNATAKRVPEPFSRRYGVIPLYKTETEKGPVVVVAMADPANIKVRDEIQNALEEDIFVALALSKEIDKALDRIWGEFSIEEIESSKKEEKNAVLLKNLEETKPAIANILESIFTMALDMRANAIHFEPKNKFTAVRYKIDGAYHTITSLPLDTYQAVLTRLKILSKIPIAESIIGVEEGRFHIRPDVVKPIIDVRMTVLSEVFGEKAILKLTRREDIIRNLDEIGFEAAQMEQLNMLLSERRGLILISGLYDSGRTTLTYSLLFHIGAKSNMIVTVEDPPAYPISSFNQIKKIKKTDDNTNVWEQTVRVVESQEPNIVFISNIDTKEEANMMIRYASTGRRVFGTLYATDSTSTHWVPFQLGVDPYALAWSYSGAVSSRLVRVLCDECKIKSEVSSELLKKYRISNFEDAQLFSPQGCEKCNGTGYRGRTGLYEVFNIYDHIKDMIEAKAPSYKIREAAVESGMITFREAALAKVRRGLTNFEEVENLLLDNK